MSHRVLVTGGAGFIGSHLCRALHEAGDEVLCLDDFSTGHRRNLAPLLGKARFRLFEQSVTAPINLEVDRIYNLASPASPPDYQADPIRTVKTNVLGALRVLELAERNQARVLQASTSEVYGDPEVHPQPEGYVGHVSCTGVRACYDEGKRVAETLFFDYQRTTGVDIRVARIFNTYGPQMRPEDGRVISNFIVQALMGAPLTIYGTGTQTRSFCFVDDMVRGLRLLMEHEHVMGPLNLGNPEEFTVSELARLVLLATGSHSRIVHRPLPADDPRQRRPDIAAARELLDFAPAVALADGLARTVAYFEGAIRSRPASELRSEL